ncbi:MAG: 2,3-bisphosphoglycerate-independent phosphoglycerate mutase [Deltaproteobacteria bacterium]|nr:2,3-bisphosphoglycerate-independent phosphoglycerate mutase [Deltaproteobacteria bacterium]
MQKRKVLAVVMDGVGVRKETFGNAVAWAATPALDYLRKHGLYTTLKAHGPWVGLPSEDDMGNSEVGHNAMGAGRIFGQGAKLVNESLQHGTLFAGEVWGKAIKQGKHHSLHFIGLLSDGNVHSHEKHLFALIRQAVREGVTRIRLHTLLDGRDVGERSGEIYAERLRAVIEPLNKAGADIRVASGGGRMLVTMDRYKADWTIVERGWKAHVLGEAEHQCPSLEAALQEFRKDPLLSDQFLPAFVITENGKPVGPIRDGDAVILFNFRGDRALEISQAFEEEHFTPFDRKHRPDVFFAGILQYDGDLQIPKHYLVPPPAIDHTLSEYLVSLNVRQFACSETQKFGHVTYFWNGNRSGYFDRSLEEYLEIPSDNIPFEKKPWMKAHEITEETIKRMGKDTFDFGRLNYANADMVGHTGDFEATIVAVATVDLMVKRLIRAAGETGTILLVSADHGNADDMFESGKGHSRPPLDQRPRAKTSHTLAPVPCYIFDPLGMQGRSIAAEGEGSLANIANTVLDLLGLEQRALYEPSLLRS